MICFVFSIIYNLLIYLYSITIYIASGFNQKAKKRYKGQKEIFIKLKKKFNSKKGFKTIWFHCSSLGEYQQAIPLIIKFNKEKSYNIVVTFFSPSGYEIEKNSKLVDLISYIPLDTKANAVKFLDIISPDIAIFIKSELWYNFINQIHKRDIKILLVSAALKESYFNLFYYKMVLKKFSIIFIQDLNSKKLCEIINIKNYYLAGDTRFDSVYLNLEHPYKDKNIEDFILDKFVILAGSTWIDDENIIIDFLKKSKYDGKLIIAPHCIDKKTIDRIKKKLPRSILYSELENTANHDCNILIINTIGILKYIYRYSHIAYIGGGFISSGIHNVLEPAVYGIPTIFGANYKKSLEAVDLVRLKLAFSIKNSQDLINIYKKLSKKANLQAKKIEINKYMKTKSGASNIIFDFCQNNILKN